MRDLQLNDFADSLRERLIDDGVDLPKSVVRRLTKQFFKTIEGVAEGSTDRFILWRRPITAIYPLMDVEKLCGELAEGKKNVVTVDYLLRKQKLQPRVLKFYKRQKVTL